MCKTVESSQLEFGLKSAIFALYSPSGYQKLSSNLKNGQWVTFPAIKIDWCVVRPPQLLLRIAVTLGKTLSLHGDVCSPLKNFPAPHKAKQGICSNTLSLPRSVHYISSLPLLKILIALTNRVPAQRHCVSGKTGTTASPLRFIV